MQIDPLTIVAVLGMASLLIERVFYYKSRYKKRNNKINNPGNPNKHGERIMKLETEVTNIKDDIKEIKAGLEKLQRPGK